MEPKGRLSLAQSNRHSLLIILIAVTIAGAAGLWAIDRETRLQEAAFVRQLVRTDARLITKLLALHRDRVRDLTTRNDVQALLRQRDRGSAGQWVKEMRGHLTADAGLMLLDTDGRILGNAGGSALVPETLTAQGQHSGRARPAQSRVDWLSLSEDRYGIVAPVVDRAGKTPIGSVFATFTLDSLRSALQDFVEPGQRLVLRDADGRIVAETEDTAGRARPIRAATDVAGSGWQLELAQPPGRRHVAYVIVVGAVSIVALAAIVLMAFSLQLLRTTSRELKHLTAYLDQIGSGPVAIQPPAITLEETGAFLPVIQRVSTALHKKQKQITELSLTDQLTKLPNHFYFFEQLRHAYELVRRGASICILAVEIDDFQEANDVLGREGADQILQMLGETLRTQTRKSDFAARLSLYNFATIFYNAKGELMQPRLEQIQRDFDERQRSSVLGPLRCTLSCGLVCIDVNRDKRAEDSLAQTERALHVARAVGGNHIEIAITPSTDAAAQDSDGGTNLSNKLVNKQL
jgi:diguanylate cyclase (GGDEF)-like protein